MLDNNAWERVANRFSAARWAPNIILLLGLTEALHRLESLIAEVVRTINKYSGLLVFSVFSILS